MKGKKGQIGGSQLQTIILTLVAIGVLIGLGLLVLEEFRSQDVMSDSEGSVTNETGAWINSTVHTVDKASKTAFNSFEVTEARNASDGTTISDSEYTVDSDEGTITNATNTVYSDVNLDYTYEYGEQSYEGVNETIEATGEIPTWLAIVVILSIVGI